MRRFWYIILAVMLVAIFMVIGLAAPALAEDIPSVTADTAVPFSLTWYSLFSWVVALAVPYFVGFVTRNQWPSSVKWLVVIVTSVVIGIGTIAVQGDVVWAWGNFLLIVGSVIGVTQTWYRYFMPLFPSVQRWLDEHWFGKRDINTP